MTPSLPVCKCLDVWLYKCIMTCFNVGDKVKSRVRQKAIWPSFSLWLTPSSKPPPLKSICPVTHGFVDNCLLYLSDQLTCLVLVRVSADRQRLMGCPMTRHDFTQKCTHKKSFGAHLRQWDAKSEPCLDSTQNWYVPEIVRSATTYTNKIYLVRL